MKISTLFSALFIILALIFLSNTGHSNETTTEIDSLKRIIYTSKTDTVIAKSLLSLGRAYKRVNSDSAHFWINKLILFSKQKHLTKHLAQGYLIAANIYRFDNNLEKSKQYYRYSLYEFERINDRDDVALAYGCIMKCFIIEGINRDSIQFYFDKTIALKDSITTPLDMRTIGDAYMDFGSYLTDIGEYHTAMENLTHAITIYDSTQDNNRALYAKKSLATIHFQLKNVTKAIGILEEIAPKASKRPQSRPLYANILTELGEYYVFVNKYNKALLFLRQALWVNENYNIIESTDKIYTLLSTLKIATNQPDSAIYFANRALALTKIIPLSLHPANLQLSKAYIQKGTFNLAEKHVKEFLKEQLLLKNKKEIANAYQVLFFLYENQRQYQEACKYHTLYSTTKDSLLSAENTSKLADMEAWYWSKQKKNELALAKKNEELKSKEAAEAKTQNALYASQRNALIIGSILTILFSILLYRINLQRRKNKLMQKVTELELKAIRAQMNPHFLFNALSAIQMLINKNDIKQSNIALAKFGRLMRLILEYSEKQNVSLEDEIKILELYIELEALRFSFNYSIEVDPAIDKENTTIPSMIIQPYVENAIKHGISTKPDNRNIKVKFTQENDQLLCTVEDDGIGRQQAEAIKSKYTQHKSMGTKLSKERLEIIGNQTSKEATVRINDLHTKEGLASGTKVELNIPITYNEN